MSVLFNKLRTNDYLRFFVRFSFVIITAALLDRLAGGLLKTFYFKQQSGLEYRTTYSLERTTADLLIFGSSTANHNYNPSIFQNRLNMSAYNVGRDGISVFYDLAILKCVLKRYRPKIIVLDFDEQEFRKDDQSYERLSSLLPYYMNHPEIRSIVDLRSPYERYKLLSHIYPYNSLLFTIYAGNAEFNKKRRGDINGYVPINNVWGDPMKADTSFLHDQIDRNKISAYESFIRDCVEANVQLYIVCPPLFVKPDYINSSVVLGKAIAEKYNVQFFDCSKDPYILNNPRLFADISHLNNEGATVFSQRTVDQILAHKNLISTTAQKVFSKSDFQTAGFDQRNGSPE